MEQEKPIRVMQIIARMNVGGPALIVAELMQGLNPLKNELRLVTGNCSHDESDFLDDMDHDIPVTRVAGLGRSVSLFADLQSFIILLRLIRQFKPDIIHTHTAKAGVLGRIAGLIAYPKAKRVHTYHGHLLHGYFPTWKTNLIVLVEQFLAIFSTALITIGNQVKLDLLDARIGNDNQYLVIFPGLGELETQNKARARTELKLKKDVTYLAFVGRLTQIKRPDRLVDIGRHLKNNQLNVELLIAGGGEKFEELQSIVKLESLPIVFLGWRKDVGKILSACDIAILCSDNEGIPLSLIQASQAGLPIISTDVGSVSDIVIDGESGLLTETNTQSLIKALEELLSDPLKMHQFGQAGKLRAKNLFSLKGMIEAHEKLYSQVIQKMN